jgi:hypothetical protein
VQPIRGLIIGTLVGATLAAFVMTTLHATTLVGLLGGAGVGISVFAVVSTKSDTGDEAADAAWRAASLDLPPVSDRLALERFQERLPGPDEKRRSPKRPAIPVRGASRPTDDAHSASGAASDASSPSKLSADPGISAGQGAPRT